MISKKITRKAAVCILLTSALAAYAGTEPRFGDDHSKWANDGQCDDPRFEGAGSANTMLDADRTHDATDCERLFEQGRIALRTDNERRSNDSGVPSSGSRIERGSLVIGDRVLASGEYADTFHFDGRSGNRAVIDLRSADFDPYVLVRTPSGAQFDNDDYGDGRALVALELDEAGEYEVTVTSFSEGETGDYSLHIAVENDAAAARRRDRNGELDLGDETLTTGEYVDTYRFQGWPGQHLSLDLESEDFDTYLILKDPHGGQVENDDADESGREGHSHIEQDLVEAGVYSVLVTSYEPGATGTYRLAIHPSGRAGRDEAPAQHAPVPLTASLRTR